MTTSPERMERSSEEWKASLTPEQYQVASCGGTERAFGCLLEQQGLGDVPLHLLWGPLFSSDTKFDSGTGWPSFGMV